MGALASIRRSLSLRLALTTIVLSIVVSVLATAVQMMFIHRAQLATYHQELAEIGSSDVPALENGLWQVESGRVQLLMDAIANVPGVGYVDLDSESLRMTRGSPHAHVLMERRYMLVHEEEGKAYPLGTLHVVIDWNDARARLVRTALRNLIATSAILLANAFVLLWLLRLWVTRNLHAMARYASKLRLGRLNKALVLPHPSHPTHPDELDQLAMALNAMRKRMQQELYVREEHEQELEMHRKHLESMVQARTAALEHKTRQLDKQRRQMQELANTDSLTGAASRRHFLSLFRQELKRARRDDSALAMMMFDVDHFKRVNDTHGHATGDRVLTLLVQACRDELRAVDIIGRLGGEEFGVILPQSNLEQSLLVAERLRVALGKLTLQNDRGESLGFTVSIGVSARRDAKDDENTLMARADAALYRAKHEGRNRVQAEQPAAG